MFKTLPAWTPILVYYLLLPNFKDNHSQVIHVSATVSGRWNPGCRSTEITIWREGSTVTDQLYKRIVWFGPSGAGATKYESQFGDELVGGVIFIHPVHSCGCGSYGTPIVFFSSLSAAFSMGKKLSK